MDRLYYRCVAIKEDVPVEIGMNIQSLTQLKDASIRIMCRCGQTHEPKIAELFRRMPQLPPLRTRDGGISA